MDATVPGRWWFFPAGDMLHEPRALKRWLFDRWAEIDRWVAAGASD